MTSVASPAPDEARERWRPDWPDDETSFYGRYAWCLNVFPTVDELVGHLQAEIARLDVVPPDWRRREVMTNVFLLACSLSGVVDDHLAGGRPDFSKVTRALPSARPALAVLGKLLTAKRASCAGRERRLRRWKDAWDREVDRYLDVFVGDAPAMAPLREAGDGLTALLERARLPSDLRRRRPKIAAAFRSQDLTHLDILALGERFQTAYPERERPVLVVGLRSAGAWFAPLLAAALRQQGWRDVAWVTVRPKQGVAAHEQARLRLWAGRSARAVVVDEPANTGATVVVAARIVRDAGFTADAAVFLMPLHPTRREWPNDRPGLSPGSALVTLAPEHYFKRRLLDSGAIEHRIADYFGRAGLRVVSVLADGSATALNQHLDQTSEEKFHTRLKRVVEVRLEDRAGHPHVRHVFAKSVGWGWLGYHAFIAAERLSGFVPPLLGLRDGILYAEWVAPSHAETTSCEQSVPIDRIAAYVAARSRRLALATDPGPDASRDSPHVHLAEILARAWGSRAAAALKRPRLLEELSRTPRGAPALIDGKMRPVEWVGDGCAPLKTDFEHHGLGKTELNVTDPAYDLADATLSWRLTPEEESRLVERYVEASGDVGVQQRLFPQKLLAGVRAMDAAVANLEDARLVRRHEEFNRQYVNAWTFLTLATMCLCASVCLPPREVAWSDRLVVLDVDGVLDQNVFGFPSTTAAGLRAVSLLHAHGLPVALDTARTLHEVEAYCDAYRFVGGVAEYGSVAWDAVGRRARPLVSPASLEQLDTLRRTLAAIPGVFVNDDYRYSIRAYTYERGRTVAVPTLLVTHLIARLALDRLTVHQTYLDTAVIARDVDKGSGLLALLDLAGRRDAQTVTVGDSEADLPMFRVATHAFAPAHVSGRDAARAAGCWIADRPFQQGLLQIVERVLHPDGRRCERCRQVDRVRRREPDLFFRLLEVADRSTTARLVGAMLDPLALTAFVA